jgi:Mg-chelatase subunit ChlD
MHSLLFRTSTAILTFLIGISVATAWVFNDTEPRIEPVNITELRKTTPAPTLEMVFVLDTTGSMGGLLEGAKQKIWSIVNDVMLTESRPAVRVGLVAYRDRGDQYVTQVLPLTSDLDQVYSALMAYKADGGGDTPEDVRRALFEGVTKVGWSTQSNGMAQILFLVGDAPPHDDYSDSPDARSTAANAADLGIVVNTIQCGGIPGTRTIWEAIAQKGNGQYFAIEQNGGVQTIATPYDEQMSKLANQLGGTFVAYGGGDGEAGDKNRLVARERIARVEESVAVDAPSEAKAERALNKAMNREAYIGDLLQSIENGSIQIDKIDTNQLPADLRKLSPVQRKQEIEKRLAERRELRAQIVTLSKQRAEFLAAERKKLGAKSDAFDTAVVTALKEQLRRKGIK